MTWKGMDTLGGKRRSHLKEREAVTWRKEKEQLVGQRWRAKERERERRLVIWVSKLVACYARMWHTKKKKTKNKHNYYNYQNVTYKSQLIRLWTQLQAGRESGIN